MSDHDLLLTVNVNQANMSEDIKAIRALMTTTAADHEARLRRIERLADRLVLAGAVVAAIGGFLGWLASYIFQFFLPPRA